MNSWKIQELIINFTNRWYISMVYTLIWALIGWGVSFVLPSPYRASLDIYVGINAYRSPYDSYAETLSGQPFRLVDDYKNWQMEQLDELVKSDDFTNETLSRLQALDPEWDIFSSQNFRDISEVLWRNAGEWHLVVQTDDSAKARQAVETWREVVLERTNIAINHARQVVALDIQMTTAAETRVGLMLRQDVLIHVRDDIAARRDEVETLSADQVVASFDHWRILGLVSQASDRKPAWESIQINAPGAGSAAGDYLLWLSGIISLIDDELSIIPGQISTLDQSFTKLEEQYKIETASSMGLASTLVVAEIKDKPPQVEVIRKSGTLVLVGGIMGLIIWFIRELWRIGRKLDNESL